MIKTIIAKKLKDKRKEQKQNEKKLVFLQFLHITLITFW
jgi:hypothetical protein